MNVEIQSIYRIFNTQSAFYIHFGIQQSNWDYLYVHYDDNSKYSLFYGNNFDTLLQKYLEDRSIECIECQLGINILGGVSFDSGELVEFNLSIQQANKILSILKDELRNNSQSLIFFEED